MCCSEESLELMELWFVLECELEVLEEDTIETLQKAA